MQLTPVLLLSLASSALSCVDFHMDYLCASEELAFDSCAENLVNAALSDNGSQVCQVHGYTGKPPGLCGVERLDLSCISGHAAWIDKDYNVHYSNGDFSETFSTRFRNDQGYCSNFARDSFCR